MLGQRHHPPLHIVPAGETGTAERERLVSVAPGVVAEVVLSFHHVKVHVLGNKWAPVVETLTRVRHTDTMKFGRRGLPSFLFSAGNNTLVSACGAKPLLLGYCA